MRHWGRMHWWVAIVLLSLLLVFIDYFMGPYIVFPITLVLPVGLAGWYLGRWPTLVISAALVTLRLVIVLSWGVPEFGPTISLTNAGIRFVVLASLGWLIDKVARQHRELADRVNRLEGLLPICSFCKSIRTSDGQWEMLEVYIRARSSAEFTHGFCDECGRKHYPEAFGPSVAGGRG
jgi:hypothetical protein